MTTVPLYSESVSHLFQCSHIFLFRAGFIIAKGGITSSDLATRGLSTEKALVLGAVMPGVTVWKMDAKSKFPGILYVVFPGNVGDDNTLVEVSRKLGG